MPVTPLLLKDPIDQDTVEALESALEKAKAGELREVVIVGVSRMQDSDEPAHFSDFACKDMWRLLGAMRYAEARVFKAIAETSVPDEK